jgi:hypothetical protein
MRETIRSLQIYMLLGGLLSSGVNAWIVASADSTSLARALAFFGLFGGLGWLYVAVAFEKHLVSAPERIKVILYFSMAYVSAVFLSSLYLVGPTLDSMRITLSFIVLWYIHTNIKRLSREEAASAEPIAA